MTFRRRNRVTDIVGAITHCEERMHAVLNTKSYIKKNLN